MPTTGAAPVAKTFSAPSRLSRLDGRVNAVLAHYKDSRSAAEPYLRLAGMAAYLVVMLVRRAQATSSTTDPACPPST